MYVMRGFNVFAKEFPYQCQLNPLVNQNNRILACVGEQQTVQIVFDENSGSITYEPTDIALKQKEILGKHFNYVQSMQFPGIPIVYQLAFQDGLCYAEITTDDEREIFELDLMFYADGFLLSSDGTLVDMLMQKAYKYNDSLQFFKFYNIELGPYGFQLTEAFLQQCGINASERNRMKAVYLKLDDGNV